MSESKETNLKELTFQGGRVLIVVAFWAYSEKGIVLQRFRVSDVLAIVIDEKCA